MKTSPSTVMRACILLVGHEQPLSDALDRMLVAAGFVTSIAAKRPEAIDQVRQGTVDLVIMNMSMPGPEAIATMICIQSAAPEMRIIAVSNGRGDGLLPLAKSLGASALAGDPLTSMNLLDVVHQSLVPEQRQVAC